jgi:pimeloyl-ACP methyl ester carboxylesterase
LWVFSPAYFNPHFADMLAGRTDARFNPMPNHAFAAQCAACMDHNVLDRLGAIEAPCLLTAGDADIFTPLHYSQEMHERLPNSELVVFRGMGHGHHWEDLARFNQVTADFLVAQ